MTREQIDAIFERAREWPLDRQEEAAEMLLILEDRAKGIYHLSDEEGADIDQALAEVERGEVASDEEVAALFEVCRGSKGLGMTKEQIESVLNRVFSWPPERQEDAVRMLLDMEKQDSHEIELSDEERADLHLAAAEHYCEARGPDRRGEDASDAEPHRVGGRLMRVGGGRVGSRDRRVEAGCELLAGHAATFYPHLPRSW